MAVLSPLPSSFPAPVEITHATNATTSAASSIAGDSITIPAIAVETAPDGMEFHKSVNPSLNPSCLSIRRRLGIGITRLSLSLWPSPHLRLLLILNIPSSKINGCIGKQYPGCKERLLLSAALGTGLGKELRDS
ncbi:hypothetical protein TIFTF001_053907 [Ficus carica]|uniref:Uncharacterized protein n=1 Tax=Ficus carica TaxID=3494 RepID=A0AA88JHN0_FICCA|nr:hypothetical protein TIFTF001_053907 [Ficus carica]